MKRYRLFIFLVLVIFIGIFGCQKKIVSQPDIQQPSQQVPVEKQQSQQKAPEQVIEQQIAKVESIEPKSITPQYESKEGLFRDILFDFDKYDIKDEFKPALKEIAVWMQKNNMSRLSIEGHCDERGTNEYNLALGDRRAKAVKDYLVSLGISSGRLDTISYGEEKPLCKEQSEECWAKNRRAHFVVMEKAGK